MPGRAARVGALRRRLKAVRVVYYDPGRHDAPVDPPVDPPIHPPIHPPIVRQAAADGRGVFRSGEAGTLALTADGDLASRARVHISPNSLHALHEHGVVAALGRLDFAVGPLAPGRDAVLRPTALSDASRILYEADRRTYGRVFEFTVARRAPAGAEPTEYRIVIDNREYQRTLSRLQYLAVTSSREGLALRLRL